MSGVLLTFIIYNWATISLTLPRRVTVRCIMTCRIFSQYTQYTMTKIAEKNKNTKNLLTEIFHCIESYLGKKIIYLRNKSIGVIRQSLSQSYKRGKVAKSRVTKSILFGQKRILCAYFIGQFYDLLSSIIFI